LKETGVVRRLDELGRVVIPKEIRKRLKIKNGDMVDIYTEGTQIVLEKYHPLHADIIPLKAFIESLRVEYTSDIIIIDDATVVYSTNNLIPNGNVVSEELIYKIKGLLDKELSSKAGIEIIDGHKLDKDIIISEIFVNYEHYGYVFVMDDIIGKRQKELTNIIINYFDHLLDI
jgi:AbrB family looped-hinge helix DNA binding protein